MTTQTLLPRLAQLSILAAVFAAGTLQADQYRVTKTAGTFDGACDADCSLREAVQAANLRRGSDTVTVPAGTYGLTRQVALDFPEDQVDEDGNETGDLDIVDTLNLVGSGGGTIISGTLRDRVLHVLPGATLKAYQLTITQGASITFGGGLYNAGNATLRAVAIVGNRAASGFNRNGGGGIANIGTLSLENCPINFNRVSNGESGRGVGGGLYNEGTMTMRRSSVSNNSATDDNDDGDGAGLINLGVAVIAHSLIAGNSIEAQSQGNPAISNHGVLTLINSTVSGNLGGEANLGAVGNAAGASLVLRFVTIADNIGGGLRNLGEATLSGALIAGNPGYVFPESERDYASGRNCVTVGHYRARNTVLGLDGNCGGQILVDNGRVFSALLEPLRLGGGVTASHKLLWRSAAVDAVVADTPGDCEAIDQRGSHRPPDDDGRRGPACDIGAYELRQ